MSDPQPSLAGKLLLADPSLREPTFARSVIAMVDHTPAEGASGFILNQPSGNTVGDLVKDPEFATISQMPVFIGGPVSNHTLSFAAFWWNPSQRTLSIERLTSVKQAEKYSQIQKSALFVRAFAGYSGWSAGQLEDEMERDSWMVLEPTSALFYSPHDRTLWAEILRSTGPLYKILAECPLDPFAN